MALLKVLLLLGLGVSVNSGVPLLNRIFGGQNCDDKEVLYHVRLESSNSTHTRRCGGSLIHPEWILTAGYCFQMAKGWTNIAILKVHPLTAVQQIQVIRYATQRKNGLVFLKLETPVPDVPLAKLTDCNYRLKVDDVVQLAGEGATTTGPNNRRVSSVGFPAYHQCVDMKVQVSYIHPTYGHVFDTEALKNNICYANVGGAAVYNGKIYGVTFFSGPNYTCQSPVVIKDVCDCLGWIKQTIMK